MCSHSTHKPPSEREGDHEVVEGAGVHTEVRYNAIVHALSLSLAFARQLPPQGAFVAIRCHLCTFKLGFIDVFAQDCECLPLRTLTQRNYYFFNWAEKLIVVQNVQIPIKLVGT